MKMKSRALALGLSMLLTGAAVAAPPAAGAVATVAPAALTSPATPAPFLWAAAQDPGQEHGLQHIDFIFCSGACGSTSVTWSCPADQSCCADCSRPTSPLYGCLSAAGVCR